MRPRIGYKVGWFGGGSVGLSYASGKKDPTCTSISAAAGAGVEANAGSLNRVTTLKLK